MTYHYFLRIIFASTSFARCRICVPKPNLCQTYSTILVLSLCNPLVINYVLTDAVSPQLPLSSLMQTLIYFLPLQIYLFLIFINLKIIQYVVIFGFFTQHNVFQFHPFCSMYQYFILFDCQITVIWIYHVLFIHSSFMGVCVIFTF